MSTITLDDVKATQARLAEMIASLEAQQQARSFYLPAGVLLTLQPGEGAVHRDLARAPAGRRTAATPLARQAPDQRQAVRTGSRSHHQHRKAGQWLAPFRTFARFLRVKAIMTERTFNLVVPLGHKPTAMRTTDTAGSSQAAVAEAAAVALLTSRGWTCSKPGAA